MFWCFCLFISIPSLSLPWPKFDECQCNIKYLIRHNNHKHTHMRTHTITGIDGIFHSIRLRLWNGKVTNERTMRIRKYFLEKFDWIAFHVGIEFTLHYSLRRIVCVLSSDFVSNLYVFRMILVVDVAYGHSSVVVVTYFFLFNSHTHTLH